MKRLKQTTIEQYLKTARFEGPVNAADCARLEGQLRKIHALMIDGCWRTLSEIEAETGEPQASISAQLRHLRKARFGSHLVDKRRRGSAWEYRLEAPYQADYVVPCEKKFITLDEMRRLYEKE